MVCLFHLTYTLLPLPLSLAGAVMPVVWVMSFSATTTPCSMHQTNSWATSRHPMVWTSLCQSPSPTQQALRPLLLSRTSLLFFFLNEVLNDMTTCISTGQKLLFMLTLKFSLATGL